MLCPQDFKHCKASIAAHRAALGRPRVSLTLVDVGFDGNESTYSEENWQEEEFDNDDDDDDDDAGGSDGNDEEDSNDVEDDEDDEEGDE